MATTAQGHHERRTLILESVPVSARKGLWVPVFKKRNSSVPERGLAVKRHVLQKGLCNVDDCRRDS